MSNETEVSNELTIVIPAKNEEQLLGHLLESVRRQTYEHVATTTVYVADACSTDSTAEIARSFRNHLRIEVIPGGLPAEGRNAGARLARSRFVLFLDADVELGDRELIARAVNLMKRRRLHCTTTFIISKEQSLIHNLMYGVNAFIQVSSKLSRPFSPGAFMLFDLARFNELGGFDERVRYAEDFFLTRNVARRKFAVVPGWIRTTNRRFRRMGHFKFIGLFLRTVVNSGNDSFFLEDHGYWK